MSSTTQIDFGPTLGALLVALVLGAVFLGITFLQTVFYYKTYSQDTFFLKSLVATLCALDTLSLILWAYATYWYLVVNFGNPVAAESIVWSDAAEPPVTGAIALMVHLFLAWRIQRLDQKWRIFSIVLTVASFVSVLSPIAATMIEADGMKKGTSMSAVNQTVRWCTLMGDVCSAMVDISIAGSIGYLLHCGRGGFIKTDRVLSVLTLYIITSGFVTAVARVLNLILTFAYPTALYYLIPYISTSKAYSNALLATLNSRANRREMFSVRSPAIPTFQWRDETIGSFGFQGTGMSSKELGRSTLDCSINVHANACATSDIPMTI